MAPKTIFAMMPPLTSTSVTVPSRGAVVKVPRKELLLRGARPAAAA
jgi:hypothetical protein